MASANAGPITGSEIVRAIQGGNTVWLTRPQVAALLNLQQASPALRAYATPTAFQGTEQIEAIQGNSKITMNAADLAVYLAATGPLPVIPINRQPTALTGAESILGLQGASLIAFSSGEAATVAGGVKITLGALSLSTTVATAGTAFSATVVGKTAGSVVTATSSDGTTLTVSNGVVTGTFANAGSPTITLVETLAGATGSPKTSTIGVTVSAAAVSAPVNSVAPVASGTGTVGQTLSVTNGTWTNSPTSYTYQWRRGGTAIGGATGSTYTLVSADASTNVDCIVTATNSGGSTPAGSNAISVASAATALPQQSKLVERWSATDIPAQADNTVLATWTGSVGAIPFAGTSAKYRTSGAGGKPFVQFTGGASYMQTSGANAVLTAMQSSTNTVYVVYRNPGGATGKLGQIIGGNTSTTTANLFANATNVGKDWGQANFLVPFATTGALETIGSTSRPANSDGGTGNGGRLYVRGCCVRDLGTTVVPAAATGICIGGSPANTNYGFPLEIYEVLVWNTTLTSVEMKQVEKWARDKYGLSYPWAGAAYFRVFAGNSISNGYGATTFANTGVNVAVAQKNWPMGTWENVAEVGLTWTQMNTVAVRDTDPLGAMVGLPVQVVAWEWNNSGRVASTTYSQCQSFFQNRRAAGIQRLVVSTSTDLSDSIDTAAQRTDRATYCNNIASNWQSFADAYFPLHNDAGASAPIGPEGSCPAASPFTPNFFDGQHPLDPGYQEYASLMVGSLQ